MRAAHFDKLYTTAQKAVELQRQRILSNADMRADAGRAAVPRCAPPISPRFRSRLGPNRRQRQRARAWLPDGVKAKLREDRWPPSQANETWAMDFVHDQLATGRKIRVLTVVDTFSRYAPVLDPRFSYRAEDVVATLEQACATLGYPKTMRVDQGSEFVSRDLDLWAYTKGVTLDFSRPGKPTDNAFAEAFNGRVRAECLNAHWFLTLADAREKLEAWRRYYNEDCPHGAIGQVADLVAKHRWRIQPATMTKARKLHPPVLQRMGSDRPVDGLYFKTGTTLGAGSQGQSGLIMVRSSSASTSAPTVSATATWG